MDLKSRIKSRFVGPEKTVSVGAVAPMPKPAAPVETRKSLELRALTGPEQE